MSNLVTAYTRICYTSIFGIHYISDYYPSAPKILVIEGGKLTSRTNDSAALKTKKMIRSFLAIYVLNVS